MSEQAIDIDSQKLTLEYEKLALEKEKLQTERSKAKWASTAVILSVVSALLTIGYGSWSVRENAKDQFAIKLAEISMASDNPDIGAGKAAALAYLFSDRMSPQLLAKLSDNKRLRAEIIRHAGGTDSNDPSARDLPTVESQLTLLRLILAAKPSERERIVKAWKAMFGGDAWWVDQFTEGLDERTDHGQLPVLTKTNRNHISEKR